MLLPILFTLAAAPSSVDLYIGTYTSKEGSRGVYRARLNERTGAISAPTLAAEGENPSYLALRPDGKTLYAVHETDGGEASAYRIGKDGGLSPLGTITGLGGAPCHLAVAGGGKSLLVANYGPGSTVVLPIGEDGALAKPTQTLQDAGSGPDKARQAGPHAHFAATDEAGRFAYVCDLGTDEILTISYDAKEGRLGKPRATKAAPGAGPRHLAFGADGAFAYVNNELDNTVAVYEVDPKDGTLRPVQVLSSLPESHQGTSHSAEIAVHPEGEWLYVSNRGDDSLALFHIGDDGHLTFVEAQPTGVKEPRGFGIDPTGRWMVVAGQNSDDLKSFPINPDTGRLGPAAGQAHVGKPVCVVFRP